MGDSNEQVAITVQVPMHYAGELKDLLREHPGLAYFKRGWIVPTFAILGPADAMERFQPKLDAWRNDCAARDAW